MCPPEDIPEDEEYTYPCECGGRVKGIGNVYISAQEQEDKK